MPSGVAGEVERLISPARLLPVVYNPSVLLNGVKSLSYAANMLASRRADAKGYDEALLVRSDGVVLEGPTCSIFWVRDGRLRTPALETGILDSITRRVILANLSVEEGSFGLADAVEAEEAFLASTVRLAQPIAAIGEVPCPWLRDLRPCWRRRRSSGRWIGFDRVTLDMRARDHGIAIGEGTPGPLNAITDVAGVRVGHTTLIQGSGPLMVGRGPVRTGVTVLLPPTTSGISPCSPARTG